MRKMTMVVVMFVSFVNLAFADHYETGHRAGLGEAVGGLVVGAVMLPVNIVSGVARGLAGGDEQVLVRDSVPTQQVVYYNQPMYSAPPFNPGYHFNYWYWQPSGVTFVSGNQHRQHNFNHGGQFQGHQIRNHKQRNDGGRK